MSCGPIAKNMLPHPYNDAMRLFFSLLVCVPIGLFFGVASAFDSGGAEWLGLLVGGLLGTVIRLAIGGFRPVTDLIYPPAGERSEETDD